METDSLNSPDENSPDHALRTRLIGLVKQLLDRAAVIPDPFPVNQQLSELGMSSLKMVNLMLSVEMEFDIMIPQADITPENFHSLASIERLVAGTLAAR
jgi:acyl carrier protein